jgi:uncharacterized membrane protein
LNTLTVWRFGDPQGAEGILPGLRRLVAHGVIHVDDAAVVSWPEGSRKPSTTELGGLTSPGKLWGGSWGMLFGVIFLVPIAGPAFGAGAAAVAGSLSDFGIDDDFIARVRETVTPGTSALFVLSTASVADQLGVEIRGPGIAVLRCNLNHAQARRVRDALGEERQPAIGGR